MQVRQQESAAEGSGLRAPKADAEINLEDPRIPGQAAGASGAAATDLGAERASRPKSTCRTCRRANWSWKSSRWRSSGCRSARQPTSSAPGSMPPIQPRAYAAEQERRRERICLGGRRQRPAGVPAHRHQPGAGPIGTAEPDDYRRHAGRTRCSTHADGRFYSSKAALRPRTCPAAIRRVSAI